MVRKVFALATVVMVLFAVLGLVTSERASAKGGSGGNDKGRARGAITAIDSGAGTVTIADRSGSSATLIVAPDTDIRKDSKHVALAALAVGDKADARYNTSSLIAKRIGAKSPKVEGIIKGIDLTAQSVTIETSSGAAVTVFATATTKLERNDIHATLADFKIGDRGQARYNAATMQASKIKATGN